MRIKSLHNRRALVVGASSGLGAASSLLLAEQGASIIAVSRNETKLAELIALLPTSESKHLAIAVDLAKAGGIESLLKQISHLEVAPEIIVHNIGGSCGVTDPFAAADDWQKVWQLNVGIPVAINSKLLPILMENGYGRVVHVASASSITHHGYTAYVSAKAALVGYVKSISRIAAAKNVVISAVAPGAMRVAGRFLTDLENEGGARWQDHCRRHIAIGRLADVNEVASAIGFLCSNEASYCAGSIVSVDGGSM